MRDPVLEEVDPISKDGTQGCPRVSTCVCIHMFIKAEVRERVLLVMSWKPGIGCVMFSV